MSLYFKREQEKIKQGALMPLSDTDFTSILEDKSKKNYWGY